MFLIRICLFLFLGLTFVFSQDKAELIQGGFIASVQGDYKNVKEYDLGKVTFDDFTVRLHVDTSILQKKDYYLKVITDTKNLINSNVMVQKSIDAIYVKLDKHSPQELYFYFNYEKKQPLNFRVLILNELEYSFEIEYKNLLYGIAYGIIFCAFLYNFVIFIYTRQRSFLYYCLMQLSLLIILYDIVRLVKMTYVPSIEMLILDTLENFAVILVILFSKEILTTKKHMPWMDYLLTAVVIFNVLDIVCIFVLHESLLYSYIPRSLVVLMLVISGAVSLFQGQRSAIFYLLGWGVIFGSLFISEYNLVELDELFIIHIGFPIESLILSFALGYKLKQTVVENNEKEQLLVHQSKLASMGEMINNIAHQWRQPLTHMSFINMDIQMANEQGTLQKAYLNEKIEESYEQIEFMSSTIESFKDFYQPVKDKEEFFVSSAVQKAVNIILPSLKNSNITLDVKIIEDHEIYAYENEYSQIVLNFLSNAKDIIIQRHIQNPYIKVELSVKNNRSVLMVMDNAKGIKQENIHKIFDPYFSTKQKSSGIGLYMSKVIVESHFNGTISAFNTPKGACFRVEI